MIIIIQNKKISALQTFLGWKEEKQYLKEN